MHRFSPFIASHNGNNSFRRSTMRSCSARGGRGIRIFDIVAAFTVGYAVVPVLSNIRTDVSHAKLSPLYALF